MRKRRPGPKTSHIESRLQRVDGPADSGRIGAATDHASLSPSMPPPASTGTSSGLSHDVLQRRVVEHRNGHKSLQSGVLALKRRKPSGVRHVWPAIHRLPLVESDRTNSMTATGLRHGHAALGRPGAPPSVCLSANAICSSVNLLLRIDRLFSVDGLTIQVRCQRGRTPDRLMINCSAFV